MIHRQTGQKTTSSDHIDCIEKDSEQHKRVWLSRWAIFEKPASSMLRAMPRRSASVPDVCEGG